MATQAARDRQLYLVYGRLDLTDGEPLSWSADKRHYYYNMARDAIGYGVAAAREATTIPYLGRGLPLPNVNAGLSNIVMRSARLNPHLKVTGKDDPFNPRVSISNINPLVSAMTNAWV